MEVGIHIPVLSSRPAPDLGRTVFKFPVELFLEIFSYFHDHRRYICDTTGNTGLFDMIMRTQHVERSTVIRKLTMTCWALRNTLLPVLWKNTEGCVVKQPRGVNPPFSMNEIGTTYGLYAQCIYLLSNPTIAAYVQ